MSRRPVDRRVAGFTLVEVMIALLILGMGLGVLLRSASGNLMAARRAEMYAVVAELSRAKMYDLEEQLLEEGFQELDQELDGDFEDEGWEQITWEATIVKIEMPNLEALNTIGGAGEDGEGGGGGAGALGLISAFMPPGMGAGGLDPTAAAGASLIGSQYELIRGVLEESIRKATLTVKWKRGRFTGDFVIDCYFVNPEPIKRLGNLASAAGGGSGGSGGTGGSGSTRPSLPTTRGNNK